MGFRCLHDLKAMLALKVSASKTLRTRTSVKLCRELKCHFHFAECHRQNKLFVLKNSNHVLTNLTLRYQFQIVDLEMG